MTIATLHTRGVSPSQSPQLLEAYQAQRRTADAGRRLQDALLGLALLPLEFDGGGYLVKGWLVPCCWCAPSNVWKLSLDVRGEDNILRGILAVFEVRYCYEAGEALVFECDQLGITNFGEPMSVSQAEAHLIALVGKHLPTQK